MPLRPRPARCFATGLLALAALAGVPGQCRADPAGELLRLVPRDTAICLVVRDLRTHAQEIGESPFVEWLRASALGKRLADPKEVEKIRLLAQFLADQIGLPPRQVLEDVLGDAVVFAYQPGPPDKPQEEAGVVLVNARKPEVLARLVERLNDLQRKSGEVKAVREKSHGGRSYFEREKSGGGREYYLLRGGVFAFSGQERAIQGVIDRDAAATAGKPGKVAAGIAALGLADVFAVCWFDPRRFDADLAARSSSAKDPGERAFLAQFARVWAATDGVALYAHPGRGLELGVAAAVDPEKLPRELRGVVLAPRGRGQWPATPPDALFAARGRIDAPRLLEAVNSFLPPEGKAAVKAAVEQGLGPLVGRDKLPAVLAGLGPEWTLWLTPPDKGSGSWAAGWTFALRLTPDPHGKVEVSRSVLQAVDFAVQMGRLAYNRDHADQIDLSEESAGGVPVKILLNETAFPPGWRPSYAVKAGHLVAASSPDLVRRFAPTAGSAEGGTLVRLSAKHLREYLTTHRTALAGAVAKWSGKSAKELEHELEDFSAVLEVFDRIEARYKTADGRLRLSLHIDFARPLKK